VIDGPSFPEQQKMDTSVSKPFPLLRQFNDPTAEAIVRAGFFMIIIHASIKTYEPAGTGCTNFKTGDHLLHRQSFLCRLYQFFEFTSFKIWISSA
jgi:hypothetical protein